MVCRITDTIYGMKGVDNLKFFNKRNKMPKKSEMIKSFMNCGLSEDEAKILIDLITNSALNQVEKEFKGQINHEELKEIIDNNE